MRSTFHTGLANPDAEVSGLVVRQDGRHAGYARNELSLSEDSGLRQPQEPALVLDVLTPTDSGWASEWRERCHANEGRRSSRVGGRTIMHALRVGLFAALALLGSAAPAGATKATAELSAGSLAFVSSAPTVSFSDSPDRTRAATQALDVRDATGSGVGWNIRAAATGASATAVEATAACDRGATCVLADSSVAYPYAMPTAAPATELFDAAPSTGMGDQTVTVTWWLAAPAAASTWTLSLSSGP
jgi:hypothetical protein